MIVSFLEIKKSAGMNKSEAVCQDISPGTRTPDLSASVPELLCLTTTLQPNHATVNGGPACIVEVVRVLEVTW